MLGESKVVVVRDEVASCAIEREIVDGLRHFRVLVLAIEHELLHGARGEVVHGSVLVHGKELAFLLDIRYLGLNKGYPVNLFICHV